MNKNIYLDEVKSLNAKPQKRDQDIYEVYVMVYEVFSRVKTLRSTINTTFCFWYVETFSYLKKIWCGGECSKEDMPAEECSNTPSQTPQELYKLMVAIPLLDSFTNQL